MRKHIAIATLVIASALGAALYLTTPADQSTAMSSTQADRLALARAAEYRSGVTAIDATIPVSGQTFQLDGRVDWRSHLGYATLTAPQQGGETELLQWTPNGIAVRGSWTGPLPSTPPADGWMVRPWQQGADLDTALHLILDLGTDQPENAQRLQQSGLNILRRDSIGSLAITVYDTPHTRYWVSDDGTLRRFEALVDGSTTWTRVDLVPGSAPAVPQIPGMR